RFGKETVPQNAEEAEALNLRIRNEGGLGEWQDLGSYNAEQGFAEAAKHLETVFNLRAPENLKQKKIEERLKKEREEYEKMKREENKSYDRTHAKHKEIWEKLYPQYPLIALPYQNHRQVIEALKKFQTEAEAVKAHIDWDKDAQRAQPIRVDFEQFQADIAAFIPTADKEDRDVADLADEAKREIVDLLVRWEILQKKAADGHARTEYEYVILTSRYAEHFQADIGPKMQKAAAKAQKELKEFTRRKILKKVDVATYRVKWVLDEVKDFKNAVTELQNRIHQSKTTAALSEMRLTDREEALERFEAYAARINGLSDIEMALEIGNLMREWKGSEQSEEGIRDLLRNTEIASKDDLGKVNASGYHLKEEVEKVKPQSVRAATAVRDLLPNGIPEYTVTTYAWRFGVSIKAAKRDLGELTGEGIVKGRKPKEMIEGRLERMRNWIVEKLSNALVDSKWATKNAPRFGRQLFDLLTFNILKILTWLNARFLGRTQAYEIKETHFSYAQDRLEDIFGKKPNKKQDEKPNKDSELELSSTVDRISQAFDQEREQSLQNYDYGVTGHFVDLLLQIGTQLDPYVSEQKEILNRIVAKITEILHDYDTGSSVNVYEENYTNPTGKKMNRRDSHFTKPRFGYYWTRTNAAFLGILAEGLVEKAIQRMTSSLPPQKALAQQLITDQALTLQQVIAGYDATVPKEAILNEIAATLFYLNHRAEESAYGLEANNLSARQDRVTELLGQFAGVDAAAHASLIQLMGNPSIEVLNNISNALNNISNAMMPVMLNDKKYGDPGYADPLIALMASGSSSKNFKLGQEAGSSLEAAREAKARLLFSQAFRLGMVGEEAIKFVLQDLGRGAHPYDDLTKPREGNILNDQLMSALMNMIETEQQDLTRTMPTGTTIISFAFEILGVMAKNYGIYKFEYLAVEAIKSGNLSPKIEKKAAIQALEFVRDDVLIRGKIDSERKRIVKEMDDLRDRDIRSGIPKITPEARPLILATFPDMQGDDEWRSVRFDRRYLDAVKRMLSFLEIKKGVAETLGGALQDWQQFEKTTFTQAFKILAGENNISGDNPELPSLIQLIKMADPQAMLLKELEKMQTDAAVALNHWDDDPQDAGKKETLTSKIRILSNTLDYILRNPQTLLETNIRTFWTEGEKQQMLGFAGGNSSKGFVEVMNVVMQLTRMRAQEIVDQNDGVLEPMPKRLPGWIMYGLKWVWGKIGAVIGWLLRKLENQLDEWEFPAAEFARFLRGWSDYLFRVRYFHRVSKPKLTQKMVDALEYELVGGTILSAHDNGGSTKFMEAAKMLLWGVSVVALGDVTNATLSAMKKWRRDLLNVRIAPDDPGQARAAFENSWARNQPVTLRLKIEEMLLEAKLAAQKEDDELALLREEQKETQVAKLERFQKRLLALADIADKTQILPGHITLAGNSVRNFILDAAIIKNGGYGPGKVDIDGIYAGIREYADLTETNFNILVSTFESSQLVASYQSGQRKYGQDGISHSPMEEEWGDRIISMSQAFKRPTTRSFAAEVVKKVTQFIISGIGSFFTSSWPTLYKQKQLTDTMLKAEEDGVVRIDYINPIYDEESMNHSLTDLIKYRELQYNLNNGLINDSDIKTFMSFDTSTKKGWQDWKNAVAEKEWRLSQDTRQWKPWVRYHEAFKGLVINNFDSIDDEKLRKTAELGDAAGPLPRKGALTKQNDPYRKDYYFRNEIKPNVLVFDRSRYVAAALQPSRTGGPPGKVARLQATRALDFIRQATEAMAVLFPKKDYLVLGDIPIRDEESYVLPAYDINAVEKASLPLGIAASEMRNVPARSELREIDLKPVTQVMPAGLGEALNAKDNRLQAVLNLNRALAIEHKIAEAGNLDIPGAIAIEMKQYIGVEQIRDVLESRPNQIVAVVLGERPSVDLSTLTQLKALKAEYGNRMRLEQTSLELAMRDLVAELKFERNQSLGFKLAADIFESDVTADRLREFVATGLQSASRFAAGRVVGFGTGEMPFVEQTISVTLSDMLNAWQIEEAAESAQTRSA
ncbi:MAG: hypothetical protein HYZ84_04350, partial [Candidatus Omnitrophica bacterium]|nr:hypothetical protein [Candidatus Omnitrophota bacterium]